MMETLKKKQHTHTLIIQNEFWFIRLPGEGWDPGAWNDTARSWVKQKPIFSVPEDALYTCVCVCVWLLFFCHTLSSRSQASWKRRQVPQEKSVPSQANTHDHPGICPCLVLAQGGGSRLSLSQNATMRSSLRAVVLSAHRFLTLSHAERGPWGWRDPWPCRMDLDRSLWLRVSVTHP